MLMRHPSLPDNAPVEVDERAFTLVHQVRGWEAVTESVPDPRLAPAAPPKAHTPARKPTVKKEQQS